MTQRASGVVLPSGHTGSSLFHAVLTDAAGRFPDALAVAALPRDARAFKRDYGLALARFEAARAAAPERVEIARFIVERAQTALGYAASEGMVPLSEHLATPAPTPELASTTLGGAPGLAVEVPIDGQLYRGREVARLADRLLAAHQLTAAARDALHWITAHAAEQGGRLDLRGERFVLLGAGAELAPTRALLQGGASVLWIDVAEPARALGSSHELAGTLVQAPGVRDLLLQPREIAAAIRAFAGAGPVHVGMFAYAPGASKEWRLGAAMNAIVASLPPALVRSVALLISPTTASVLTPESVRGASERLAASPRWQRALAALNLIEQPGHYRGDGVEVSRATVALQGLSYQAAQYISKIAAAESYALFGTSAGTPGAAPVTVSANVAGITRTRSLSHPLFEAAFAGADRFGVRIFEPATTRALTSLLLLHDLLNPHAPAASPSSPRERAQAVLSQQIHGGLYSLPYVLDGVIKVAAAIGLAGRPGLLLGGKGKAAARRTELPVAAE